MTTAHRSQSVTGRALLALSLIAGFVLTLFGIAALMAWLFWEIARLTVDDAGTAGYLSIKLLAVIGIVGGAALFAGLRALKAILFTKVADDSDDLPLTRADAPALFALVDDLARQAGTAPPARIELAMDVNAAVRSGGGLLRSGGKHRVLTIGLGLLQLVDESELRAVIAHEMGHYVGGDTRLGGLTYRGAEALNAAWRHMTIDGVLANLTKAYSDLYWRVSLSVRRRQELSADQLAARVTDPDSCAAALVRLDAGASAFTFTLNSYCVPAIRQGFVPADLYSAFREVLAARQDDLTDLHRRLVAEPRTPVPFDSHPTLAQRLQALGHDGTLHEQGTPARGLLVDPERWERLASRHFVKDVESLTPVEWDEIAERAFTPILAGRGTTALLAAGEVTGQEPTVAALLLALSPLHLDALLSALYGPSGAEDRDAAARVVALSGLQAALLSRGRRVALSWSGPAHLVDKAGRDVRLAERLDAAVEAQGGLAAGTAAVVRSLRLPLSTSVPEVAATTAPAARTDTLRSRVRFLVPEISRRSLSTKIYDLVFTEHELLVVPTQGHGALRQVRITLSAGNTPDALAKRSRRLTPVLDAAFDEVVAGKGVIRIPYDRVWSVKQAGKAALLLRCRGKGKKTWQFTLHGLRQIDTATTGPALAAILPPGVLKGPLAKAARA